ncbi:MAG TPA: hypothetical protein VM779_15135 [Thermoanaerobaculia bacterium]|nr:hypothetical protein [Thermoanaerobaculia bacterium]
MNPILMRPAAHLLALPFLFALFAACDGEERGVQPVTEVVREITTGIRPKMRVEVSVKASAEEPTAEDIATRKKLEDRIEQENIGRLISSGGGAGYYDVTVEVDDTAEAIPRIQEILRSMELARDAKFKVMEVR